MFPGKGSSPCFLVKGHHHAPCLPQCFPGPMHCGPMHRVVKALEVLGYHVLVKGHHHVFMVKGYHCNKPCMPDRGPLESCFPVN